MTNFCPIDSIDFDFAVKSLCKKYKAACNGVDLMQGSFEKLSKSLDPTKLELWKKDA